MYSFHGLTVTEALLLAAVAYDRYEAICNPLRYPAKMTRRAASARIIALLIRAPVIAQTSQLTYRDTVHHCSCEHPVVLQAARLGFGADFHTFLGFSIATTVSVLPLSLVTLSRHPLRAKDRLQRRSHERFFNVCFPSACGGHLLLLHRCGVSVLQSGHTR